MNMHHPETAANPPTSRHDVWAQPEQTARAAQMLLEKMQDNPDFLRVADEWAAMLLDGQTPAYTERGRIHYADAVTIPDHFTYQNPFPERRGFVEWDKDDLKWPNPMIHLALDAAVKKRSGNACFVAVADPQRFDAYDDTGNDPYTVGYFVLGHQEEHVTTHPQETAERALAVFTQGTFKAAELAPRYSEAGVLDRQEAKAAAAEAHAKAAQQAEAARELGESALKLLGQNGATVLARVLAKRYKVAADSTEIPREVHNALRHVWIPSERPGTRTTPRSLQALQDAATAGQIDFGDILKAGATLFPNDSADRLLQRFVERSD